MKTLFQTMLTAFALGLGGCYSFDRSTMPLGGEHAVVRNYGWYLFDCVPVGCGNASENRRFPIVLFRDDVIMDKMQEKMIAYASNKGYSLEGLTYTVDNDIFLSIPFAGFSIPVPYILTYHEVQLSGVMK